MQHNEPKLGENIKPQVPGILTQEEKAQPASELKEQELFYRAIGR